MPAKAMPTLDHVDALHLGPGPVGLLLGEHPGAAMDHDRDAVVSQSPGKLDNPVRAKQSSIALFHSSARR